MLKHQLKRGVSALLGNRYALDVDSRVVVLCYHSIHTSLPFASASPDLFRAQLEWLTDTCDVVPLVDVPALARVPRRSRPAVAITFDDGYRDNYSHAFPILEDFGARATFFLTVGVVEGDLHLDGRVASTVEDLARTHCLDAGHNCLL